MNKEELKKPIKYLPSMEDLEPFLKPSNSGELESLRAQLATLTAERNQAQSELAEFHAMFDRLQQEAIDMALLVERLTKTLREIAEDEEDHKVRRKCCQFQDIAMRALSHSPQPTIGVKALELVRRILKNHKDSDGFCRFCYRAYPGCRETCPISSFTTEEINSLGVGGWTASKSKQ